MKRDGRAALGGLLIWPQAQAREVLRRYRDFTRTAPENASAYAALGTSPDGLPMVLVIPFFNGPIGDGEALLRPLRDFGPPVADLVQPMPYAAFQQLLDPLNPPGNRVYWKSAVLRRLDDDAIDTIIEHAARPASPLSAAIIEFYGGAANRVGAAGDGLPPARRRVRPQRRLHVDRPAQDEANIRWSRGLWEAVWPFSPGSVYVNFLGADEGEDRVRAAYGPNYDRLAAIKARYDPSNLFRSNQNIQPAG